MRRVGGDPAMDMLRRDALARVTAKPRFGRTLTPVWGWAAAAMAIVTLPAAAWQMYGASKHGSVPSGQVYRTNAAQRLTATLEDGSRLTLNVGSQVRVVFDDGERRLILDKGQALFEVAKDRLRPFLVVAGSRVVTAHGTMFDVRREPTAIQIALIEGKVSVSSDAQPGSAVAMVPDDVLVATNGALSLSHVPGRALALAGWQDGNLIFVDQTLGEAVAEMNRYGAQRLEVADADTAALRISGSFRIGQLQPFLDALELGFPVTVTRLSAREVKLSKKV